MHTSSRNLFLSCSDWLPLAGCSVDCNSSTPHVWADLEATSGQHLVATTILLYCHDMYFLLSPQFAEKFYADPKKYALKLQLWILNQRYLTYVAAMEHIANTGEKLCTCHILGECRSLWGEHCMHFRHRREPKLLGVSEVTILVVTAHCWHQSSWD